jgi:hypothetical protein
MFPKLPLWWKEEKNATIARNSLTTKVTSLASVPYVHNMKPRFLFIQTDIWKYYYQC